MIKPRSNIFKGGSTLLSNKQGEYFDWIQSQAGADWCELKKTACILVQQYDWIGRSRSMYPIVRKFLKSSLEVISDNDFRINPIHYFNLKEAVMSISLNMIKAVNTNPKNGAANFLKSICKRTIERAIRRAEAENEFLAIASLQEELKKYATTQIAKIQITSKDAVKIKLQKTSSVNEMIWEAILTKAQKIGDILEMKENVATVQLEKKDSAAYIEGAGKITGITVKKI